MQSDDRTESGAYLEVSGRQRLLSSNSTRVGADESELPVPEQSDITCGQCCKICCEDCNLGTAVAWFAFYAIPFVMILLCGLHYRAVVDLVSLVCTMFKEDSLTGFSVLWAISMVTVPLSLPYELVEITMGYCLISKYGQVGGLLLMFPLNILIFVTASLPPFLLTRHLCKGYIEHFMIRRMRVMQAVTPFFETQGFKMTLLVRLMSGPFSNKMVQAYILAATKVRLAPFIAGTALGIIPQTLILFFVSQ